MSDFIELPISLINTKLNDLGINSDDSPAKLFVKQDSVIAFREAMDEKDELSKSIIYLISGESFFIEDNCDSIKKIFIRS